MVNTSSYNLNTSCYDVEQEYGEQKDENISMEVDFEYRKNDSQRPNTSPLIIQIVWFLSKVLTILEFKKKD